MVRLENVTKKELVQTFEGKTYVWGPGEAMDLPDNVGRWMIQHVNNHDYNEKRKRSDTAPWLVEVEVPEEVKHDVNAGVIRAQHKAKPVEPAQQQEKPAAPAQQPTPAAAPRVAQK